MAGQSPLVGYNTNVRHKGKLYHIQTEDSGVNHPHVITHLFADGGRIIASRKTGYAEHLGSKDLAGIVKKLMQEQHKAMFIELRDCVYDSDAPPAPAAEAAAGASPDAVEAPATARRPSVPPLAAAALSAVAPHAGSAAEPAPALIVGPPVVEPAPALGPAPASTREAPPLPAAVHARAPSAERMPAVPRAPGRDSAPPPPPPAGGHPRPAQPATVSYSSLRAAAPLSQADIEAFDRAADARLLGSVINRTRTEAGRRGLGRYQQTVAAKPAKPPRAPSRSIFGGEALRGKSLDEVILSYLSDDAGEGER